MELQTYISGYAIIYINSTEFKKKRGYVSAIYVIVFAEDAETVMNTGDWEVNENEELSFEDAENWCRRYAR